MNNNSNYSQFSRFETGIGPMTDRVLNTFIERISSPEFKDKISDK